MAVASKDETATSLALVRGTEFAALAQQQDRFAKLGRDIVTVSTDTKFVHLAWQRSEKELATVRYTMASDPTGSVSRAFGVYDEGSGLDLHAWSDGTTAVIMEPLDVVARLAALVPAPGRHLLRYHGTLAPLAKRDASEGR